MNKKIISGSDIPLSARAFQLDKCAFPLIQDGAIRLAYSRALERALVQQSAARRVHPDEPRLSQTLSERILAAARFSRQGVSSKKPLFNFVSTVFSRMAPWNGRFGIKVKEVHSKQKGIQVGNRLVSVRFITAVCAVRHRDFDGDLKSADCEMKVRIIGDLDDDGVPRDNGKFAIWAEGVPEQLRMYGTTLMPRLLVFEGTRLSDQVLEGWMLVADRVDYAESLVAFNGTLTNRWAPIVGTEYRLETSDFSSHDSLFRSNTYATVLTKIREVGGQTQPDFAQLLAGIPVAKFLVVTEDPVYASDFLTMQRASNQTVWVPEVGNSDLGQGADVITPIFIDPEHPIGPGWQPATVKLQGGGTITVDLARKLATSYRTDAETRRIPVPVVQFSIGDVDLTYQGHVRCDRRQKVAFFPAGEGQLTVSGSNVVLKLTFDREGTLKSCRRSGGAKIHSIQRCQDGFDVCVRAAGSTTEASNLLQDDSRGEISFRLPSQLRFPTEGSGLQEADTGPY